MGIFDGLIGIQPLTAPTGQIFKLKQRYSMPPDEAVKQSAKAPLKIEYNGAIYYRLGGTDMTYVSKFHKDVRGFWLLASLYYNPATNLVIELTCDGHKTESNFQNTNHIQLFEDAGENIVCWILGYFRYRHSHEHIIIKRMAWLGLKPRKYVKKINGTYRDVMKFKTPDDYAQFRLYFSEYFL